MFFDGVGSTNKHTQTFNRTTGGTGSVTYEGKFQKTDGTYRSLTVTADAANMTWGGHFKASNKIYAYGNKEVFSDSYRPSASQINGYIDFGKY